MLQKQSSTNSGFPIQQNNFKSQKQIKTAMIAKQSDWLSVESKPNHVNYKTLNYNSDTNTNENVISKELKKQF